MVISTRTSQNWTLYNTKWSYGTHELVHAMSINIHLEYVNKQTSHQIIITDNHSQVGQVEHLVVVVPDLGLVRQADVGVHPLACAHTYNHAHTAY